MAKILKQIWFDVIEPPDRSFVWVRPESDTVYNTYIYGNSGWSLTATNNNVVSITPEEFDAITDIDTSAFYVVKDGESPTADLYFGGTKIGLGDSLVVDDVPTEGSDNLISSGAVFTSLESKQNNLVSGVNIKTINDSSILGNGNIGVQEPLISGVTIKTINEISVLGTGNVAVQPMLSFDSAPVSQSNNPVTSDGIYNALTGKQATLVSGSNIKTVNGTSLLGEGDITVQTQMTLDDTPTSGSENAVKSGGVYSAIAGKQETISTVNVTLENNSGAPSGSASVNGGTVNFIFSNINGTDGVDGVGFNSISSPQDGTATITLTNGDTVTLDLNHNHPQYLKYVLLADEAAYAALATKDSDTLYLIPEE